MTELVLENLDATKSQKFQKKLEKLEEEKWTRDNFREKAREVENAIRNIDDYVTGLQDQFDRIVGNGQYDSRIEEIEDEVDESFDIDEVHNQVIPGTQYFTGVKKVGELQEEARVIVQKIVEWRTLQLRLSRLKSKRLEEIALGYKDEYVSSEVASNFEKFAEQMIEEKMERAKQEIKMEFKEDVAEIEKLAQAIREESKFYRDWHEEFGEVLVTSIPAGDETGLNKVGDSPLDEVATEDGSIDLSGDEKAKEERENEREEAMDEISPRSDTSESSEDGSSSDVKYEVRGKSTEEKIEVFEKMRDEDGVDLASKSVQDVAEMTDVSAPAFYKENGILDSIEDEVGHTFGIRG
ncbi:MAG: hypothetical protein ABEJ56_05745 [Candidatus Nanohaloarchaea archaeon]